MTRILHVIHTPRYSGAEMLVASLTKAHSKMGHVSRVVAMNPPEPDFVSLILRQQHEGVDWITPDAPLKGVARARFIRKAAICFQPDLTFAHSVIPATYARIAGVKNVVPVLHSEKNFDSGYHRLSEVFLQYKTSGVIAVSEIARQRYSRDFKRPKSIYIANGIDAKSYGVCEEGASKIRKVLGLKDDDFFVIQVGRISRLKRQHLSIHAAAPVIAQNRSVHLALAGLVEEPEYLAELKLLANELDVERNVHFLGPRDDVSSLLCAADLFVMPSAREAQSIAMMEALAAGLPIIGSSIEGLRFAQHFAGVCLLDPEDDEVFTSSIRKAVIQRRRYDRELSAIDIQETAKEYLRFGELCMS